MISIEFEVIRRGEDFVPLQIIARGKNGTRLLRPVPERYARAAIMAWRHARNPESPPVEAAVTLLPVSETVKETKGGRIATTYGRPKVFAGQDKRTVRDTRPPHHRD